MSNQERLMAPSHPSKNEEQSAPDGKFAIERDYLDKKFNEIGGDSEAQDDFEEQVTRLAYDERNSYVMEYLKKI